MVELTEFELSYDRASTFDRTSAFERESKTEKYFPWDMSELRNSNSYPEEHLNSVPTSILSPQRSFEPPTPIKNVSITSDSIPIQIWEGTVSSVNLEDCVMNVVLEAKMGNDPRHTADIDLEWVSDQDKELVCSGAVFYLTLFKQTKRGSIQNSQELRFRRRPSWSTKMLEIVDKDASELLSKMAELPSAE